jgi:aromatic ring-cleaving dioxygenase
MQKLDPDQLQFVEIIAKLMNEYELFQEEYSEQDFNRVITWLKKLRSQIDITIESLGGEPS